MGDRRAVVQWEPPAPAVPLAPLTTLQTDLIFDLADIYKDPFALEYQHHSKDTSDLKTTYSTDTKVSITDNIDDSQKFLKWYDNLECSIAEKGDVSYQNYWKQLEERKNECETILRQVDAALQDFNKLSEEYDLVSNKTNALHAASAQLIADQTKHFSISSEIKSKLHFFSQVENVSQRLSSPTLSVSSDAFFNILRKIDECMDYLKKYASYKESHIYLIKYRHCLSRAFNLIRSYVTHILTHATEQVLAPRPQLESEIDQSNDLAPLNPTADTAFALYFGKFQAAAPKLKNIFQEIEQRVDKSEEYSNLLQECQQSYLTYRAQVISQGVDAAIKELTDGHKGDHCTLMRSACSFLIHISQDEWDLFFQFFSQPSPQLVSYLMGLCNTLYDTLRPYIIHINHLETLAELCTILKIEMLEEHVNNNPEPLAAFGRIAAQLLQDSQERLAYRAHVCLRSDVLNYKPAPGDLAYPEKLLMMEQIALSIQEQSLKRSDSFNSMVSVGSVTSQEVANINHEGQRYKSSGSCPADLHGMWYPGVRRTLATLSRLYRCLERTVFQGLSQEALVFCIMSVENAANQISSKKTIIDGELFQIKHLLILREQIAPFQVDFTVKETTLDFSKVKSAAYGLIQKRNQLFALNSNNALLEFLLDGTPLVKEHLLDSRKEVDRKLKSTCETFIEHSTNILIQPLLSFLNDIQKRTNDTISLRIPPEKIAIVLLETQRLIKGNLASLQRSMQLYLANKETEFILFRPIRNNVVGSYMQIEQLLNNGSYSSDDILIVSCPTPEQVTVLLTSSSLQSINEQVPPYSSNKKKISTIIKSEPIPTDTGNTVEPCEVGNKEKNKTSIV